MGALINSAKKATGRQVQSFTANENLFAEKWRLAEAISQSSLIPQTFRGKTADVMLAMEVAEQMKLSIFMVTQNMDIIHGRTGWKSTFIISAINSSGMFASKLKFEFRGKENADTWSCRAYAKEHDGSILYGTWISLKMAKDEGWYAKSGSKWQTMPEQMLQYRAASFFGRLHASDLLMGMQASDEIIDVVPVSSDTVAVAEEIKPMTETESLVDSVEKIGFKVSGPTKGKGDTVWLKAEPLSDEADIEGVEILGFVPKDDFYVMNITGLS